MRILPLCLLCLSLVSCVDESFEELSPVPQDIFDPGLKDLFEFTGSTHPNRSGGFRVSIVNFDIFDLRIPAPQEDLLSRIEVVEGETVRATLPLDARRFIDETRRRSGTEVCMDVRFITIDDRRSRASTFCFLIP